MYISDEEFLQEFESEEYKNIDWNNLPSLDSKPKYYEVRGLEHRRLLFVETGKEIKDKVGIAIRFNSLREAESFIDNIKDNQKWNSERLTDDQTIPGHPMENNELKHKEYYGPLIPSTLHIVELEDDELSFLHFMKECKNKIDTGQKVFPMLLP